MILGGLCIVIIMIAAIIYKMLLISFIIVNYDQNYCYFSGKCLEIEKHSRKCKS